MRVWIITVGEPVPTDPDGSRLWRSGLTAQLLADRGHRVTWWTSTMDHFAKRQRFDADERRALTDTYDLVFLHGPHYDRNIGLARIRNHRRIARQFARLARQDPRPDIILCSLPTLELSREAVRYGQEQGVPVVLDIRDQWPDFMLEQLPHWLRPVGRPVLKFMFDDLREACRGATAFISNAPSFIDWAAAHGERRRSDLDRFVPHGYPPSTVSDEQLGAAAAWWDEQGVVADDGVANICFLGSIRRTVLDLDTVAAAAGDFTGRVRFVICGLGDDLPAFRAATAATPSVITPGWVGEAELRSLMARSVAGLAPYRRTDSFAESLPNKPVEYMSAGLPVLSSLEGFTRDLLTEHDCGYFYSAGDAGSLTKAVDALLADPDLRRRRSEAAASLFDARYSAERVYGELADYLETLASGSRPVA